jgi:hypothetical protein
MKHDESALVKQALQAAREQLAQSGRLLPAAYMLVANNPQTGARLTHPTAIAAQRDAPFTSAADYQEFLALLRSEARRLAAMAVAIAGEAEAEIETERGPAVRRVFYLRIEDQHGVEQLHAAIENVQGGGVKLGPLLSDPGNVGDLVEEPILPR